MTEKIIEVIKDRSVITGMDQHISAITGETLTRKPIYYRHTKTGAEYCHIAGGIGWPGEKPGFIVVVGVEKTAVDPRFHILEERESENINCLLTSCLQLREKYGFGQDYNLFKVWHGQNERFDTFVNHFNHDHELKDHMYQGIYLAPPHDCQKPNAFEIWLNAIRASLEKDAFGKRKLFVGNHPRLLDHLQNFPVDVATKGSVEEYPAISCLGGTLHSLMMLRPWLKFARPERTVPTIQDPLRKWAEDHERALWEAENGFYGDGLMDQYNGSGEMLPTL
jgi:hypothetical protein